MKGRQGARRVLQLEERTACAAPTNVTPSRPIKTGPHTSGRFLGAIRDLRHILVSLSCLVRGIHGQAGAVVQQRRGIVPSTEVAKGSRNTDHRKRKSRYLRFIVHLCACQQSEQAFFYACFESLCQLIFILNVNSMHVLNQFGMV